MGELLPGAAEAVVYAGAVFVLNATPGVDFLLTVGRTLAGGARAGVAAALGISSGCIVHALAAAFGLAALLAVHPGAFALIQWAGAAYLAWLGIAMLRTAWGAPSAPHAAAVATASTRAPSAGAEFRTGLLTNLLNPKVALFFLAFIPQFVPAASPHKTLSFLLLSGWFLVQSTVFLLALVAVAVRLGRLQASRRVRRVITATGGGLFLLLALRLALAERPPAAAS